MQSKYRIISYNWVCYIKDFVVRRHAFFFHFAQKSHTQATAHTDLLSHIDLVRLRMRDVEGDGRGLCAARTMGGGESNRCMQTRAGSIQVNAGGS